MGAGNEVKGPVIDYSFCVGALILSHKKRIVKLVVHGPDKNRVLDCLLKRDLYAFYRSFLFSFKVSLV